MSSKEILDVVYQTLRASGSPESVVGVLDFIEQEWQTQDLQTNDVQEIERHRGLVIGEDGTVKELKD